MEELSLKLQCIKFTSKLYGPHLNIHKTKVMVICNVDNEAKQLTTDNNTMESVNNLMYLSAQIHTNGESSMDIRRKIEILKTP